MRQQLEPLFTPWKIGNCEIKNRIVMAPMCLGFGQFARRYQVVDKRVVACLVYHTLALSELVNAAVANVRQQYAIGANGQECKRGAHCGLASTAVVKLFVECVKLTIGFG